MVNGDLMVRDIFSQHSRKCLTSFVWLKHRLLIFFRTRCLAGKGINPSCTYSIQQTHSETPSQDQSGTVNGLTSRQGSQADCRMTFPCVYLENQNGNPDPLISSRSTVQEHSEHVREVYLSFDIQLTPKARCPPPLLTSKQVLKRILGTK